MQCKHFITAITALALGFASAAQSRYVSPVWVSDNGNGTYKNPVLHADYSDPDAVRVGDDFYMTASSFNCTPGLPILHSKDLVNWRIINYALKKQVPLDVFSVPQHGKGVWAPAIRYHNNEFYIYYPDPDFGIYMIKTKDPAKDWSEPVLVLAGKGYIDPCPLWDDNGKAYLIIGWAGSRAGINSILTIFQMNKEGTRTIDDGKHVYDGHGIDPTLEGPKLYKRNGYYYIFAPAGGVSTGWQLALRSKNIYGPYERKVVMSQGASIINGPHQGALVDTKTGEDWFLHFQDIGPYGRVVHLQPVVWKNNWPVIGVDKDGDGNGDPVLEFRKPSVGKSYPIETPVESDEFNADTLGLQWQWHANPKIQWSALMKGNNFLRLFAYPDSGRNMWSSSNLLLQKFPAPAFTVTTKITFTVDSNAADGKKAGLLVMGSDYSYISIVRNKQGYSLSQVICKDAMGQGTEEIIEQQPMQNGTVYLRVAVTAPGAACIFSYSDDGTHFKNIGKAFTAKEGRWIGTKVGLFCTAKAGSRIGGYADVDWFRITK